MTDRMTRAARPLIVALALASGLGQADPLTAQSGEGQVSLAIGTTAPDVTLEDLDGNETRLFEVVDGRPALIEFWATWCENCEALQPQMDEIQERFGDQMAVVAVAVAVAQSQRRVRRHVEGHDPGYPYLWDGAGAAVRAYEATTTSIVVLLDGEGKVAYTGVGGDQDLIGAVETLIGG